MNLNIPESAEKRVVIVGGGFAGLNLINKLKKSKFQIVLIDKNNYHQFPPLLYQVASAGLESDSISFPFRKLFHKRKNFFFRMAELQSIVPGQHLIRTSIGDLRYDYLVLAYGTTTNFFGNETIRKGSFPMKTIEEGLRLRNRILSNLEEAILSTDPQKKQALLNIVIVGGGATGVEVAGALSEMKRFIIPKDYPDLGAFQMNIYLVEGSSKLLGALSGKASAAAEKFLADMGVIVRKEAKVVDYKDGAVCMDNGDTIPTETLVWVSGITGVPVEPIDKTMLGRGNRIRVNAYNQLEAWPEVYAIGDICLQAEGAFPNGHPQVAQVAIQQGSLLADNLVRLSEGLPMKPFAYRDLGSLATVGRDKAVADINRLHLQGFLAWMVWLLVHLRSILGIKNRLIVMIQWVWSYFTYDKSTRFILYVPKEQPSE